MDGQQLLLVLSSVTATVIAWWLIISPVSFLSLAVRYTLLISRYNKDVIRKMSTDFGRPLMTMVLDDVSLSELGTRDRRIAQLMITAIRTAALLGWLVVIALPFLFVR